MRGAASAIVFVCGLLASSGCAHDQDPDAHGSPAPVPVQWRCDGERLLEARGSWQSSEFRSFAPQHRRALLRRSARCAVELNDHEGVIAACRAAPDSGLSWAESDLAPNGTRFRNDAMAIAAFHCLASGSPERLAGLVGSVLELLVLAARRIDATGTAELRIHDLLAARHHVSPDGSPDDALRVHHARVLMQRGEIERARQRLAPVVDPRQVLVLRISRAFDPLRGDAAFERRLDMRAAAEAALNRARSLSKAQPRRLSLVRDVVDALGDLGRRTEALTLIDRALALAQVGRFDDAGKEVPWLLNDRAVLLHHLGRSAERDAALRQAIALDESGRSNVSQRINFAALLEATERPAEALEMLRQFGSALSPHGHMWVAAVRACAAEQLGDPTLQREAMRYPRTHERDNVDALARGLLCVNDMDGAAALYIRRLRDPVEQQGALLALQIYPEQGHQPRRAKVRRARLAQVRERADVRAAVEAVGRIEEVPAFGAD